MRALINDLLRNLISYSITMAGLLLSGLQRLRILSFAKDQARLKRRYGLTNDTPVLSYGPELEQLIQTATTNAGRNAKFAFTSGSSGKPKRILYTKHRLRALNFAYSESFARACEAFRIKRTSLYVFSSLQPDDSLTSLLLDEDGLPSYFATLQAPYRVQRDPTIRALTAKYGSAAVRLWILAIANPGVFYSTNPSTISTFFDDLAHRWRECSTLIKDWCENPKQFDRGVRKIARRLDSVGSKRRLQAIAASDVPISVEIWAPALEAYICWTGGYVKPFLDRVQKYLPAQRYRLIPMYSMSTETLETTSYFQHNDDALISRGAIWSSSFSLFARRSRLKAELKTPNSNCTSDALFIPLAQGVVYEFIEETDSDQLIGATEVEPGKTYAMVVSDGYSLRRYHTGDLFFCRRKVNGLPDLVFVRRRGLAYSFTGEKLTGEQVSAVFEQLRAEFPDLLKDNYLTCVPSQPAHEIVPHYKLLLIGDRKTSLTISNDLVAARFDELLKQINCEYKSKRASGRLGAVRFIEMSVRDFAGRLSRRGTWESQFKFLPLCQHTWESGEIFCSHFNSDAVRRVS